MEPIQNPTQDPAQNPPIINNPQPKSKLILITLSVITILLLSLAAFLYIQNQKLQKQILKPQPSTTVQVPTPTPKKTATISISPDETAGWEIYTNNENGYSIKFPQSDFTRLGCIGEELIAEKYGSGNRTSPMTMISCERDSRYDLETKTYASIQAEPEETKYYDIVKKDIQLGGVSGKLYIHTFTDIEDGPFPKWFAIAKVNKNNKTYEVYLGDKSKLDLFDQILSTFKFIDKKQSPNLPADWTYYKDSICNINLPIPPKKLDIDNRTWKTEIHSNYDFFGYFKGSAINVIHRNLEEASGFISGIVTVACGQSNDSLIKLNSDFHSHLTLQNPQNTIPEALIELTSNKDVTLWGKPVKEMTFVGGMFDPKQKYYLLVNSNKWYLVTKKSDSSNSEINQQTDQIFSLLKFVE